MAASSATDQSVQLRVMVDKERKKVVYAEAGKDWLCEHPLSIFKNQKCSCGDIMDTEEFPKLSNGFVEESATFIICDDLNVLPNVFETIFSLLQNLGVDNSDTIQEQTVDVTKKEVIDLLKLSLLSKTPLTDFIFNNKQFPGNSNEGEYSVFDIGNVVSSDEGREMSIKVKLRKSKGEILFVEAEEDFAAFLFSFLTFPLGLVLHMLEGFSLGCLNNIYESMKKLSPDRYLISQDHKDKLTKPKIAPQFDVSNHILPIGTTSSSFSSVGFTKGPSTYMVTGDLVVTPMLYAYAVSYLKRSEVPIFDLEEKVIKIGLKEALCILKASLVTTNALTNCLNQFIGTVKDAVKNEITIKEEN